ncbi:MAG: hypothetical protein K2L02_03905, partial [Clostridia bacterium]|nr:hypothetical protein [Clostridia bacterium]
MSFFRFDNDEKSVETVEAATEATFAKLNSHFAAFANESTYSYTDYTKIQSYIGSADNTGSDTTTVTIDRTATHGSQANPFVINSLTTWDYFVADAGADANHFYEKVVVLAKDLDFKGHTFTSAIFGGVFYGLGHTLSNITCANNDTWAAGVFSYVIVGSKGDLMPNPTVIADLNVDNYKFTNAAGCTGGLVGWSFVSHLCILNCHTKGTIERTTAWNNSIQVGGICGNISNNGKDDSNWVWGYKQLTCYRCSADLTVKVTEGGNSITLSLGGICGRMWNGVSANLYDCYTDVDVTSTGFGGVRMGTIIGSVPSAAHNNTGGSLIIRNCVGKLDYISNGWGNNANAMVAIGQLFSINPDKLDSPYTNQNATITVQNTYTAATAFSDYRCAPWMYLTAKSTENMYTATVSNVKYSGIGSVTDDYPSDWGVTPCKPTGTTPESSESILWTNAKKDTAFKSKIWEDKSYIGGTYSIEHSPVRNKEVGEALTISFYNLKQSGSTKSDEAISGKSAITYNYTTSGSKQLGADPAAPSTSHTFLGWSRKETGENPAYSLDISNLYGHIKLYAVWEITGITSSISQSGGTLNTDTNKYEAESGSRITVNANVTVPSGAVSSSNLEIVYNWKKGGVADNSLGTENAITITNSAQSGTYSYSYTVRDKTMPLTATSGICNDLITIEITGKSTTLNDFNLTSPAYVGGTLNGVTFSLIMVDGNTPVAGTWRWENANYTLVGGENTVNVVFTPNDTTTYKVMTVPVKFTPEQLTLTFDIPSASTSFEVDIDYNQTYSPQDIVDMFIAAYQDRIDKDSVFENSVKERSPLLDGTEIDSYNTELLNVTSPQTITVTFTDPKSYNVTLNYGEGDGNKVENVSVYWNQKIPTPTLSQNVDWQFDGWFITENGIVGNTQWDFTTDRVTSDISLPAKWTRVILTLLSIKVTPPANPFTVT